MTYKFRVLPFGECILVWTNGIGDDDEISIIQRRT